MGTKPLRRGIAALAAHASRNERRGIRLTAG